MRSRLGSAHHKYYECEAKKQSMHFVNKDKSKKIFRRRSLLLCFIILLNFIAQTGYCQESEWIFVEKKNGVSLFKNKEKIDGIIPFKAKTVLHIPHEKIVKALINTEKKSSWAPKLKKTKIHKTLAYNQFIYSEYYSVPFPFFDREFYLLGTIKSENGSILFTAENPGTNHKAAEDHVLVDIKKLDFKITPVSESLSQIEFTFIGDFSGMVPKFVVNIIQSRWPVKFIYALAEYIQKNETIECERYNTYIKGCQSNKKPG